MSIKCCLSNCNIDEFTIYYKGKEVFYIRFIYRREYMSQVFKQDLTDNSVRTVIDINLGEYASGTR